MSVRSGSIAASPESITLGLQQGHEAGLLVVVEFVGDRAGDDDAAVAARPGRERDVRVEHLGRSARGPLADLDVVGEPGGDLDPDQVQRVAAPSSDAPWATTSKSWENGMRSQCSSRTFAA